jgi:ABC-type glycerol-3-phosphate transport system substrate-binding protein
MRKLLAVLAASTVAATFALTGCSGSAGAEPKGPVTLTFWRLGKVAGWDAVFILLLLHRVCAFFL